MTKWDLPQECRSGTTYENMVSRIKGKKILSTDREKHLAF